VAVQIQRYEEIAGKERSSDRAQLSRVPDGLLALGQESAEILVPELCRSAPLAKRQSVHGIPTLPFTQ
jgi:hypothetical protein